MRPSSLVVVTGTGTEVGKTWVAAATLSRARQAGWSVAARKPAQSFEPGQGPTDAEVLAAATGEPAERVCPPHRSYQLALAPPMAAEKLGVASPTVDALVGEVDTSWPDPAVDIGLVEGAGGVASPLAEDGDTAELARRLDADVVVVVADPALGVINGIRLAHLALGDLATVVYLNRYDGRQDLHRSNLAWLTERDGFSVVTTPGALLERIASTPPGRRTRRSAPAVPLRSVER